jgi:predicted PurR-regulated permease PerM
VTSLVVVAAIVVAVVVANAVNEQSQMVMQRLLPLLQRQLRSLAHQQEWPEHLLPCQSRILLRVLAIG